MRTLLSNCNKEYDKILNIKCLGKKLTLSVGLSCSPSKCLRRCTRLEVVGASDYIVDYSFNYTITLYKAVRRTQL